MAVRDAQNAANCLTRRSDRPALRAAILILLTASHVDSAKMYAQKYVHECLLESDWSAASDIIAAEPSFKVHSHVLSMLMLVTDNAVMENVEPVRIENVEN